MYIEKNGGQISIFRLRTVRVRIASYSSLHGLNLAIVRYFFLRCIGLRIYLSLSISSLVATEFVSISLGKYWPGHRIYVPDRCRWVERSQKTRRAKQQAAATGGVLFFRLQARKIQSALAGSVCHYKGSVGCTQAARANCRDREGVRELQSTKITVSATQNAQPTVIHVLRVTLYTPSYSTGKIAFSSRFW